MTIESVKTRTAEKYADVDHVEPAVVASWMADGSALVLLDTREANEYAVSHLRGAQHVEPNAAAAELEAGPLRDVAKDTRIITYCAVGVRSAKVAQRLRDAGFTNVHNMNGSIFQWVNEGRPVFKGDEQVEKVHPYDGKWGKLLDADRRAVLP